MIYIYIYIFIMIFNDSLNSVTADVTGVMVSLSWRTIAMTGLQKLQVNCDEMIPPASSNMGVKYGKMLHTSQDVL